MANNSSGHGQQDLEAQQTLLLAATSATIRRKYSWRTVFLTLRAWRILISIIDSDTGGKPEQTEIEVTALLQGPTSGGSANNDAQNINNTKLQQASIARIVKEENLNLLKEFGGVQAIAEALNTDIDNGIPGSNEGFHHRTTASTHIITHAPPQAFFKFLLKACNSYIIFLLLLSAMLSLTLGFMKEGFGTGWYEGAIITIAVLVLVCGRAIREYWLQSLQKSSNQKLLGNREMDVEVIRGGQKYEIPVSNVLSGDIACLTRGNQLPGDGLFISGKLLLSNDGRHCIVNDQYPFLRYGSKVINGSGRMLVTSVGENTLWGEMMSSASKSERTPLVAQIDKVSICTQVSGIICSVLGLVALILRYELKKEKRSSGPPEFKGKPAPFKEIMEAIMCICMKPTGKVKMLRTLLPIFLIGIAEGFPFVLALAITYWNKRALGKKADARKSSACVSMGSITTIVTDKTAGLTLSPYELDMFCIGEEIVSEDSVIAPHVLEVLSDSISMPILQGHCTSIDNLLLSWATLRLGTKMETSEHNCINVRAKEDNPCEAGLGVLIQKNGRNGTMYLHWRGHPVTILAMCSCYYDCKGNIHNMDEQKRFGFMQTIEHMLSKNLTTMAFAYKQVDTHVLEESNLVFLGMMGLKETCWTDTKDAIEDCRKAGVNIKLVSGDTVPELENIARKCGILVPNSDAIVIDGETFRTWTDNKRKEKVDKISVMGNALPSDRHLLVKCLKEKDQVVAVVGATTNEAPALKEADVGIATGTWSTQMVRNSSDIFAWDGGFRLLTIIIHCGRCTYENIQKYIQLELTAIFAGLSITLITTAFSGNSPISGIQLLWVAFLVTASGGLALLTDPPREKLMQKPTNKLITITIWRNIITQYLYQTSMLVTFHFKGQALPGINEKISKAIVFNSFVLCQIFNLLSAREPEMKNVIKGVHQHLYFFVAVICGIASQEAFMEIAHIIADDTMLNWKYQGVCFLIGSLTLVVDWATKCLSGFILYILIRPPFSLHNQPISMTPSSLSESAFTLEIPLINSNPSISNLELQPSHNNPSTSADNHDPSTFRP